MRVEWVKCEGGGWCSLIDVNLDHTHVDGLEGVYVIWLDDDGSTVRVGQGNIRERLLAHRNDPDI